MTESKPDQTRKDTDRSKNQSKGEITRDRLMDVAEAHLSRVGYRGLSLLEVAREVGISKPSVYYHFPEGKEQLFVAIAHRSLRRVREGMERAMSGADDGATKLRAATVWLMTQSEEGNPLKELDDVSRFVDEQHQEALSEGFRDSCYGPIRRVISSAIESREFREDDPDFLTWSFLGLVSGMLDVERTTFSSSSLAFHTFQGGDDVAERMMNLFLNGALL